LPRLYGDVQSAISLPSVAPERSETGESQLTPLTIEFDEERTAVTIEGRVELARNAPSELMILLAKRWLAAAGQGLEPLDYPYIDADTMARELGIDGGAAVRQRINRARILLVDRFRSAGLDVSGAKVLIENNPWHGYRLAPDRVIVRVRTRK
jgi:hypothetical protein